MQAFLSHNLSFSCCSWPVIRSTNFLRQFSCYSICLVLCPVSCCSIRCYHVPVMVSLSCTSFPKSCISCSWPVIQSTIFRRCPCYFIRHFPVPVFPSPIIRNFPFLVVPLFKTLFSCTSYSITFAHTFSSCRPRVCFFRFHASVWGSGGMGNP